MSICAQIKTQSRNGTFYKVRTSCIRAAKENKYKMGQVEERSLEEHKKIILCHFLLFKITLKFT